MKRLMAIDYGTVRIGIALSDPMGKIAFPHSVLRADDEKLFDEIVSIVEENDVSHIYVGEPLLLSGKESALSREVHRFVKELRKALGDRAQVRLVDERLTTKIAERLVREGGHKPSSNRGRVDMVSAAVILQSVLDYLNFMRGEDNEV